MEDTPLMMASSRTNLNINQNNNDETRYSENFEDGDYLALRTNHDWKMHIHHSHLPGFLIGGRKEGHPKRAQLVHDSQFASFEQ